MLGFNGKVLYQAASSLAAGAAPQYGATLVHAASPPRRPRPFPPHSLRALWVPWCCHIFRTIKRSMTDRLCLTNALTDANLDRQNAECIATVIVRGIHNSAGTAPTSTS